jgi:hypothetical protein
MARMIHIFAALILPIEIRTSTVDINDESRGRPFQKAKVREILIPLIQYLLMRTVRCVCQFGHSIFNRMQFLSTNMNLNFHRLR